MILISTVHVIMILDYSSGTWFNIFLCLSFVYFLFFFINNQKSWNDIKYYPSPEFPEFTNDGNYRMEFVIQSHLELPINSNHS